MMLRPVSTTPQRTLEPNTYPLSVPPPSMSSRAGIRRMEARHAIPPIAKITPNDILRLFFMLRPRMMNKGTTASAISMIM